MKYGAFLWCGCLLAILMTMARADDEVPAELPFWSIATSDFHADLPRPISVPGVGGRVDYYWYWTFKFRYRTNLEVLSDYLKGMHDQLEKEDALSDLPSIRNNIERLKNTIAKIGTNDEVPATGDNRQLLEQLRWRLSLYISLRTDTNQVLTDLGNEAVRNLVNRQENKNFLTVREIQKLKKKDLGEETFDPQYGKGHWINGIAIFSGMLPATREFELRVTGLGQRVSPNFVPGQLIYTPELLAMDTAIKPTMRRVLRFFYHKIGQSGEAHLDTMTYVRRAADWLWVWPLQVYPGRARDIIVTRDPELADVAPVERHYLFFPYFIWNNTTVPQKFAVANAGLVEDFAWRGEKVRVEIYDDGGADARWKDQVMREIVSRQDNGEEKTFVENNEAYPVRYDNVEVQQYYANFADLNLSYMPESTGDRADETRNQETIDKLRAAQKKMTAELAEKLKDLKDRDIDRKSSFVLNQDQRLYAGEIPAGKVVNGVAILRWGITDLDVLIDELIARLQIKAVLGDTGEEGSLLAEYQKLRRAPIDATRVWTLPPEPSRLVIVEKLAQLAEAELEQEDIKITEDDTRRYGSAAAIGVLFNNLARKKIEERAANGLIDAYFKVLVNSVPDTAYVTAQYQRYLPQENAALPPMEDQFKTEGTLQGAGKGSVADTIASPVDSAASNQSTVVEDEW